MYLIFYFKHMLLYATLGSLRHTVEPGSWHPADRRPGLPSAIQAACHIRHESSLVPASITSIQTQPDIFSCQYRNVCSPAHKWKAASLDIHHCSASRCYVISLSATSGNTSQSLSNVLKSNPISWHDQLSQIISYASHSEKCAHTPHPSSSDVISSRHRRPPKPGGVACRIYIAYRTHN